MIWTYENKQKTLQLDAYRVLIMRYRSMAMLFLFQFAYSFQYELATYTEAGWTTRPLTKEQFQALQQSAPDPSALQINFWWRWGFFIALGVALSIPFAMAIYFSLVG